MLIKKLIDQLISAIREEHQKLQEIFLITEHAEKFFSASGFTTTERENVPEVIRELPQFKTICPSSAAVMIRKV